MRTVIIFYVDKNGVLQNFTLKPEVTNSDLLYKDIKNSVQSSGMKWTPATCNGASVDSKLRLRINFWTETMDVN